MGENKIKSGKEILDSFFDKIHNIENVDTDIAKNLAKLYKDGKLTEKSITNILEELRKK